jgi:hypothetical protein
MDGMLLVKIVEQYCREVPSTYKEIKITRIADRKTMFVEQIGESGRTVMFTEYKVDGATCWAGYSSRSQTVYISLAG